MEERTDEVTTEQAAQAAEAEASAGPAAENQPEDKKKKNKKADRRDEELEALKAQLAEEKNNYLRLLAEYDNYRKRSQKEKDHIYADGKADTLEKFLPVYDNLERALQNETADEAYKKGVEMTMTGLREVLGKCGVEVFGEKGEPFDPSMHNALMHTQDESLGENVVADVFQKGFKIGEKIVRFAAVRVAN